MDNETLPPQERQNKLQSHVKRKIYLIKFKFSKTFQAQRQEKDYAQIVA